MKKINIKQHEKFFIFSVHSNQFNLSTPPICVVQWSWGILAHQLPILQASSQPLRNHWSLFQSTPGICELPQAVFANCLRLYWWISSSCICELLKAVFVNCLRLYLWTAWGCICELPEAKFYRFPQAVFVNFLRHYSRAVPVPCIRQPVDARAMYAEPRNVNEQRNGTTITHLQGVR